MKIVECPRDAMQGIHDFIPTHKKAAYINALLNVGFDTIDFGSFVSPKAIPQLKDTAEVLSLLDLTATQSKLLAIVANTRGAQDATQFQEISYLGYPLSISETFQQRNTNRSIAAALEDLQEIQTLCQKSGHKLVVYLSMGFGNPYNDPYDVSYLEEFIDRLKSFGVSIVSIADTVGSSTAQMIENVFSPLLTAYPEIEIGAHLHSVPDDVESKIVACVQSGVTRLDGALKGFGGCPMAADSLVGNLPTELIVASLMKLNVPFSFNENALEKALVHSQQIF